MRLAGWWLVAMGLVVSDPAAAEELENSIALPTVTPDKMADAFNVDYGSARGVELVAAATMGGTVAFIAPSAGLAATFFGPVLYPSLFPPTIGESYTTIKLGLALTALTGAVGAMLMFALLFPLYSLTGEGEVGSALTKSAAVIGASAFGAVAGGFAASAVIVVAMYYPVLAVFFPAYLLMSDLGNSREYDLGFAIVAMGAGMTAAAIVLGGAVAGGIIGPALALKMGFPVDEAASADVE